MLLDESGPSTKVSLYFVESARSIASSINTQTIQLSSTLASKYSNGHCSATRRGLPKSCYQRSVPTGRYMLSRSCARHARRKTGIALDSTRSAAIASSRVCRGLTAHTRKRVVTSKLKLRLIHHPACRCIVVPQLIPVSSCNI